MVIYKLDINLWVVRWDSLSSSSSPLIFFPSFLPLWKPVALPCPFSAFTLPPFSTCSAPGQWLDGPIGTRQGRQACRVMTRDYDDGSRIPSPALTLHSLSPILFVSFSLQALFHSLTSISSISSSLPRCNSRANTRVCFDALSLSLKKNKEREGESYGSFRYNAVSHYTYLIHIHYDCHMNAPLKL